MPGTPTIVTSCDDRSSSTRASASSSRATSRCLPTSVAPWTRSTAIRDRARTRLPRRDRLRLALRLDRLELAVVDRLLGRAERLLADDDRVHGAAPWSRAAVLITSPAAIDSPASGWASTRDERLAGVDSDPHLDALLERPVADRERRANRPLGIVLVRRRRAEERHHRVADELLDRAAVALELGADVPVVAAELGGDVLGVDLLGARREADEVGEEDGDDLPLPAALCHAAESRLRPGSALPRTGGPSIGSFFARNASWSTVGLRVQLVAGRIPAHHRPRRRRLLRGRAAPPAGRPRPCGRPGAGPSPDARARSSAAGRSRSATAAPAAGAQRAPARRRPRPGIEPPDISTTARMRGSAPAVTAPTRAPRLQPTRPMRFGSTCGQAAEQVDRPAHGDDVRRRRSAAGAPATARGESARRGARGAGRQRQRHADRAPPGSPGRRQEEPLAPLARAVQVDRRPGAACPSVRQRRGRPPRGRPATAYETSSTAIG